jgi:MFS family permease
MFMLGGVFSAQFGMSAVYGSRVGLSVSEISLFVSSIYVAALVLQYPIGWLSDRMDRRVLIIWISLIGAAGSMIAFVLSGSFAAILISGAIVGGTSNPLYALLIAYVNDYLESDDRAAASGGLLFINGVGAIAGPLTVGLMMDVIGNNGFWLFTGILMFCVGGYGLYRSTQRSRSDVAVDEQVPYAPVSAASTPIAAEWAQEYYIDEEEQLEADKAP